MINVEERAKIQANVTILEELGDAIGGWTPGNVTARRKSFTITVKFDNEVDPFVAERFARVMSLCPQLYVALADRVLAHTPAYEPTADEVKAGQ